MPPTKSLNTKWMADQIGVVLGRHNALNLYKVHLAFSVKTFEVISSYVIRTKINDGTVMIFPTLVQIPFHRIVDWYLCRRFRLNPLVW